MERRPKQVNSGAREKGRKLPEVLTEQECEALLAVPDTDTPTGLRNLCIIILMMFAGLKVSEIAGKEKQSADGTDDQYYIQGGLKENDIDWQTGDITVQKKPRKPPRTVHLGQPLMKFLRMWRKIRPPSDMDLLFVTLAGKKLNNRYIREFLEQYGKKAQIQKRVHPSLLRHTYAAMLYRNSRNLMLVQRSLGHVDLATTSIYAEIIDREGMI